MTKDETLKLALEALDNLAAWTDGEVGGHMDEPYSAEVARRTITAIKEALAQPEQDGKCKYCTDGCPACDARKLPEQEPVAWIDKMVIDVPNQLFYTAPRTWVGLTLDERIELAQDVDWAAGAYCEYAEKIEAKLKEKNR